MTDLEIDGVTGAVAGVELVVDLPIAEVWALVTDVNRIGVWSPECVFAAWRPSSDGGDLPLTGLREGVEHHPDRAAAFLAGRLDQLRRNMAATLHAMMDPRRAKR